MSVLSVNKNIKCPSFIAGLRPGVCVLSILGLGGEPFALSDEARRETNTNFHATTYIRLTKRR